MEAKSHAFLTDTHAHLASSRFAGELGGLLDRAREAGVGRIVSISCDEEDVEANLELASRHSGIFARRGSIPATSMRWAKETGSGGSDPRLPPGIVAIGEIGLDFYHPPGDGGTVEHWRARQQDVFEAMLQMALDLSKRLWSTRGKAVRRCWRCSAGFQVSEPSCIASRRPGRGGTGPRRRTLAFLHRRADLSEIRVDPGSRGPGAGRPDLLETDAPYLAPVPFRGKSCEPAMVRNTALKLAEVKGLGLDELAVLTSRNAERFFGIGWRGHPS